MLDVNSDLGDGVSPLEAILALSRSASEDRLPSFLSTVADTVHRTAGFTTVVLNLFRPAWDDYEAALVIGSEESIEALAGTTTPRAAFARLFSEGVQRLPGVFFLPEESGFWHDLDDTFTPDLPPNDDPDGWQAGDGLLVFLSDSEGEPLAFVSMDEPVSGRRPTDDDLRLIRAICSHAEQALEGARRGEWAAENQRILSLLLEASPALSACATAAELFAMAGRAVVPHLGFERFAAYSARDGELDLCATLGWSGAEPATLLARSRVEALLAREREHAGCFLVRAEKLYGPAPIAGRSLRNGRGSVAWNDHCLIVPCHTASGALRGLIVIEDPIDRLTPSDDRRRAVALLVDQVTAALTGIDHRERLNHLATHDPLTGVRNRRGLDDLVAAAHDVALLVCDLDHFKQVNDRYGHDLGDRVLARFGDLLRELARENDVPMRLGGEEFCIVLPNTDRAGAVRAAERLRAESSSRLRELVPGGITVSIGVAATSQGRLDARALMAAADRGLYAAKAAGRNRSVLMAPSSV